MSKEISTKVSQEVLEQLKQSFPTDPGPKRIILPRIGMVSQDKTEGKGKAMKVVAEAGTFFIESETDEMDEDGKKVWVKEDLGTSIVGVILFRRKQLRHYDEPTETYTSSPVYDTDDEIVPLFANKKEVARGTPEELKKGYEYTKPDGKIASKLEENVILYVLYKDEVFQLNLRGSSMYEFKGYARKIIPNTVVTEFGSLAQEKGSISWNKMTFKALRQISAEEAEDVVKRVATIKAAIAYEKATYAASQQKNDDADKELDEMTNQAVKQLE